MKEEKIDTNTVQINNENNNNINDSSTNTSASYEIESFEIEKPLIITDEQKTDSSFNFNIKNNKDFFAPKISYPANFFSLLTFSWVHNVIRQSKKNKDLKFSYLGEVDYSCKSEYIFDEIAQKWYGRYKFLLEKLKEMHKRSIYPLFATLIKANYCRIIFSLVLYIAMSILDFLGVFIFKELLSNFKENSSINDLNLIKNENKEDETGISFLKGLSLNQLVLLMILYKMLSLILNRQTKFISEMISVRTTTQLNLLIYDKLLKIPTFNMDKFNEGKIINLFQIDSESFGDFITNISLIILVPFKIIYSVYLLLIFFGFAFIPGIIILVLMAVLFCVFGHKQKSYHKECMKATDERMNITARTFDIIKMIKLYSWEKIFKNKINEKRDIELKANYKKIKLQIIVATIYWTVETFLCMTCISFYNIFYHQMEVDKILTALYVINGFVEPLFFLPQFFVALFETVVSLIRIQNFLSIKNHDHSQIEYLLKDSKSPYSIEISDVDFGIERTIIKYKKIKEEINQTMNFSERNKDININGEKPDEKNLPQIEMQNIGNQNNDEMLNDINTSSNANNKKKMKKEMKKGLISENEDKGKNKEINHRKNSDENDGVKELKLIEKIILLKDVNVKILKGEHIGIIGEVGSGKSCLLNAFINNLKVFSKNRENGNIKLSGKISFVGQNPWILNTTLEENILFFSQKDEERYNKVISVCQLEPDLKLLPLGDKTVIGEKGLNLSGGQKARLSIARAIYSNAEIYIFDDPLSALDAYVGMNLFKGVFNDFLKDKTFIISTHALQYLSFFDRIFYMNQGKIEWMGSYQEIVKQKFYTEFVDIISKNEKQKNENEEENDQNKDKNNKAEGGSEQSETIKVNNVDDISEKISFSTYMTLIKYSGGYTIVIKILLANIIWKLAQISSDYYLSSWSAIQDIGEAENDYKLIIYILITLPSILSVILRQKFMGDAYMNFNIKMHDILINKLINAPINLFHDITPRGQIIGRLSKDLNTSSRINNSISGILRMGFQILGSVLVCAFFNIWTLPVIIIIISLEICISIYFMQPIKNISRLEGKYRSPLLGVFSETLSGLNIIRCFQYEDNFINKFYDKMDDYFKICIFQSGISGWYGIILDMISFLLLSFILISCLLFKEKYNPQSIGLLLSYSINLIEHLFNFMGRFSRLSRMLISVERCDTFTKVVQEQYPNLDTDENLPKYPIKNGKETTFISEGKITFNDYSAKYRPNTPLVLKNISFEIKPREKLGVVGRTGSGKSTLCLSLFRLIEANSGSICIDGIDISQIGLEILRNNLTIIPQEPILIEGTLRENVDPTNCYTDKEIINMLNEVGLDEFFVNKNLDYKIENNGVNISIGEKQLICIARALIKKTKIILMDEATANIDYKTETYLQRSINAGMKDCTVITIAHRIKTIINYDKIVVLNNGEIVEIGSPKKLLDKKGLFYQLYKESLL